MTLMSNDKIKLITHESSFDRYRFVGDLIIVKDNKLEKSKRNKMSFSKVFYLYLNLEPRRSITSRKIEFSPGDNFYASPKSKRHVYKKGTFLQLKSF